MRFQDYNLIVVVLPCIGPCLNGWSSLSFIDFFFPFSVFCWGWGDQCLFSSLGVSVCCHLLYLYLPVLNLRVLKSACSLGGEAGCQDNVVYSLAKSLSGLYAGLFIVNVVCLPLVVLCCASVTYVRFCTPDCLHYFGCDSCRVLRLFFCFTAARVS